MKMIPPFPYWKFIIHSSLSHPQALSRLSSAIAPPQQRPLFGWDTRTQAFTGTLTEQKFCIERIIRYRNSFLPTIYGQFIPTEKDLQVRIVMTLNPLALIVCTGLGLCALPVLVAIVYRFSITGQFEQALKTPFRFILFLYLIFTGGFVAEAVIARRLLNHIFLSRDRPTG